MNYEPNHRRVSPLRRGLTLLLLAISLLVLTSLIIHIQSRGQLVQAQELVDLTPTSQETFAVLTQTFPIEPTLLSSATPAHTPTLPEPEPTQDQAKPVQIDSPLPSAFEGRIFFSLNQNGRSHLYAYHPQLLPVTRLTASSWDDITPAASPDGGKIAFASNRAGTWDLYLLDLATGETNWLTDTPAYDAAPSWSPDGRWLAYESYTGEADGANLEIFLQEIPDAGASASPPVQLTIDPGADYSPAWSPSGRLIAFISDRSGEAETWLADLDRMNDRFKNLSQNRETQESHPAWAPDGSSLAWGTTGAGFQNIQSCFLDDARSACVRRSIGSGNWPVWSPDGGILFTSLPTPNQTYLAGYSVQPAALALPPLALEGSLTGLTWGLARLPEPLPGLLAEAASVTPTPARQPVTSPPAEIPGGRQRLVSLEGVAAEYPLLQDQVDEAFTALRSEATNRTGWDFLSSLESAYTPLTTPLFPGMQQDWLYTGRAFSFNTAPLHAGWVVVVREDFGSETYWRVYLRARFQDGSMGIPLQNLPWSIDARSSGDPRAYEQGGSLAGSLPGGYWIDFTQLAAVYGWERLPALTTWRAAYQAARYNEFVNTGGLDWLAAMQEIYPPEALINQP